MIKLEPGVFTDEVIMQLVDEHNMMERILKDILPIISKDHPELIFKYMEYFKVDESHLKIKSEEIENVDIF